MCLLKLCPVSLCVQTIASLVDVQGWKGEPIGGKRPLSFSWEIVFPRFLPFNEFIVCARRFGVNQLGFRGTRLCWAQINWAGTWGRTKAWREWGHEEKAERLPKGLKNRKHSCKRKMYVTFSTTIKAQFLFLLKMIYQTTLNASKQVYNNPTLLMMLLTNAYLDQTKKEKKAFFLSHFICYDNAGRHMFHTWLFSFIICCVFAVAHWENLGRGTEECRGYLHVQCHFHYLSDSVSLSWGDEKPLQY